MDDGAPSRESRMRSVLYLDGLNPMANVSFQDALPALILPINQNLEQWCMRLMDQTFEVRQA